MLTGFSFEKTGFHGGQFTKTKEEQEETLQDGRLSPLPDTEKEQMLVNFEKTSFHGGSFGKTKEGQETALQDGRLVSI